MTKSLVIEPIPGVTPMMGSLLGMLRYARKTTLSAVDGLTVRDLDHLQDSESNSIGALLNHVAAVEAWYQASTFDEGEWTDQQAQRWQAALELGPAAREQIRGHPLAYYLELLTTVRTRTEAELRARDDVWLAESERFSGGVVNNHWKWFHVFEDEINHRGQIRWLRARLPL